MNYSKISASLQSALWPLKLGDGVNLKVSIKTLANPTADQIVYLNKLGGVNGVSGDTNIFGGELTLDKIDQLSEKEWVSHLELAQKLSSKIP